MRISLPTYVLLIALSSVGGEVVLGSEGSCHSSHNKGECSSNATDDSSKNASTSSTGTATSASSSPERAHEDEHAQYRCNIYMAPSSIKGAGFGIYTMNDIAKGEKIIPYSEAPSINLCDEYSNGMDEIDWNHVDYLWSGKGLAEYECKEASESVMTFGALSNFHTYLTNVNPLHEPYDDTAADRFKDPSAGSFSYLNGHAFEATRAIKAGSEIFADYGEAWLDNRDGTFADYVPRHADFAKAERLFRKIQKEIMGNNVELTDAIVKTIKNVASAMDVRVATILPETVEQYLKVSKIIYQPRKITDVEESLATGTLVDRSIEWIKDNGICLDLIRPGKSTIPGAGKGGFAQGFMKKGTIISPGPLLNVKDKKFMKLHDLYDEDTNELEELDGQEVIGEQLLVNYCYGHVESPLLFCPQTNMILLNHCSPRKPGGEGHCGKKGPNAKVKWGTLWDPDTPKWLDMSLEEVQNMTNIQRRGLSLEVVATRDIYPGEEVLIDYGENWEAAYEYHVANWKPPVDDGSYVPVRTMIDTKDFRTVADQELNPYPQNVINVCFFDDGKHAEGEEEVDGDYIYESRMDGSTYIPKKDVDHEDYVYECKLEEKETRQSGTVTVFTARVFFSDTKHYILTDFPEEAISFRMKMYSTDQFLPGAFRHFIEIEDDIFPEKWKVEVEDDDDEDEDEDDDDEDEDDEDDEE